MRADIFVVKAVLTVVVYVCLVIALGVVSLFTRRPDPTDGEDDDF